MRGRGGDFLCGSGCGCELVCGWVSVDVCQRGSVCSPLSCMSGCVCVSETDLLSETLCVLFISYVIRAYLLYSLESTSSGCAINHPVV